MSIHCKIKQFPPAKTGLCAMFDNVFEPVVLNAESLIESIYSCRAFLDNKGELPEWCDERIEYESKLRQLNDVLKNLVFQMWEIKEDFSPTLGKKQKAMRDWKVIKKRMKAAEEAQRRETTVGDAHEQEESV